MLLAEDFITAHTAPDDVRATMNFKVNSNEFNEKFLSHRPLSSVQKPQTQSKLPHVLVSEKSMLDGLSFPAQGFADKNFSP